MNFNNHDTLKSSVQQIQGVKDILKSSVQQTQGIKDIQSSNKIFTDNTLLSSSEAFKIKGIKSIPNTDILLNVNSKMLVSPLTTINTHSTLFTDYLKKYKNIYSLITPNNNIIAQSSVHNDIRSAVHSINDFFLSYKLMIANDNCQELDDYFNEYNEKLSSCFEDADTPYTQKTLNVVERATIIGTIAAIIGIIISGISLYISLNDTSQQELISQQSELIKLTQKQNDFFKQQNDLLKRQIDLDEQRNALLLLIQNIMEQSGNNTVTDTIFDDKN